MQAKIKDVIKILTASLLVLGLIACGEEREHKPLPKIETFNKTSIDTEAEYLYVPSTDEVSRSTSEGRPYWQGEQRIVKFKFEKNYLVAYAQEKDDRFGSNVTNNKPVFRIPITHIDYREARDPFGEGTNIEEENNYIEWNERRYFQPKPEAFEFADVNTLPAEFGKIFGYECSTQTGQAELNFDVNQAGIDIVIKRDYRTNYFCSDSITDLFDLAWSEVTHYSLVPLNNLISKDYETIIYKKDWENTFGFFQTLDQKLDSANNSTQDEEFYYLNRWNPNRKEVVYYLDPRFEKPENQSIKQATLKGFERLNVALEQAGLNFRLVAKDGPKDMRPGDLRYTSVVLVEDPLVMGLLGYGPSVANPRTGEIVQARTVMYPGVMRQYIRMAYDEVVRREKESKQNSANLISSNPTLVQEMREFGALSTELRSGTQWKPHQGDMSHLAVVEAEVTPAETDEGEMDTETATEAVSLDLIQVNKPPFIGDHHPILKTDFVKNGDKTLFDRTKFSLRSIFQGFKEQNSKEEFNIDPLQVVEFLSKNNMTPARLETFVDITDGELKNQVLALGQQKTWDELDDTVRKQIVDLVLPYVWIPTFIHEVGHNLGLRHNFAGSEDEAHFYTHDELKHLGVNSEMGSPYASMMEYTKSELTSLRVPGKYDIAALRYGYAQKVALQDGSIVDVKDKLPADLTLEVFEFCSDEGVSLNPNCNRFDEGVGYKQIAEQLIDSYKDRYALRNFRNGRANFSLFDEIYYAASINSQFRTLRLMMERFSDILLDFGLDMQTVEQIEWLKDMNEGAKIAGQFFQDVIAEADLTCVLAQNGQFSQTILYNEIKTLTGSYSAKNCFDIGGLANGFEVIGEYGRQFASEKYRDNPNIYLDQIDVRGVWIDKLLAMKYLVARNLNEYSFDERTVSFLDHPEIGSQVNEFIKNVLIGDIKSKTDVTFVDGSVLEDYEFGHTFSTGYDIKKPLFSYVSRYLGVKYDKIDLVEALASIIQREVNKGETSINNDTFRESVRVYDRIPEDGRPMSDFEVYKLGSKNYVVSSDNELGTEVVKRLKLIDLYNSQTREQLILIFNALVQNQPLPAGATPEQLEIAKSGFEPLLLFLRGENAGKDYYFKVLSNVSL